MIKICNDKVEVTHFPDGTQCIKFPAVGHSITWLYDSDEELFTLASCVDFIKRTTGKNTPLYLTLPYVCNSRMDRIKNPYENFSLKVFANFINSFGFDKVYTYNVHSNVSEALIDGITNILPNEDVKMCIEKYNPDVIFFPDEGACKRYSELEPVKESNLNVAFGIKKREWKTGEIKGLDVVCDTDLTGKKVLIVDDICSAGGTFKFSAKKLKEMGASDVALYISHCEDNIQNGDLLKTDLISKIYTTDSILHIEDPKIEVITKFRS